MCTVLIQNILWLTSQFKVLQHVLPITIPLISIILKILGKQLKLYSYLQRKFHHRPLTSQLLGPNIPISTQLCSTCSLYPTYTHTRPSLHQTHYSKNVHVTSYRWKVHTISVKGPAETLAAEDTEMKYLERNIGMKTEIATSYNGGVTQPTAHCSICMLNCEQWRWARRIHCITGTWNRIKFKVTHVYRQINELATYFNMK